MKFPVGRKVRFLSIQSDVIIVGGGASGIFTAILCAREGLHVVVLEQKERIGKKLLATGNGKCNYTNRKLFSGCYRGENPGFVEEGLMQFGPEHVIDSMKEMGIYPKDKNGYIYPRSEQASSMLDVFLLELEKWNVQVCCEERVKKVKKEKDGFVVETQKNRYLGRQVVLATGGQASAKLGSDGSGYNIAKQLGHGIIPPVPALIGLRCKEDYYKEIAGVRTESEISLYIDEKYIEKERGELQLTNYGISGIVVFQLSRYAAVALEEGQKVHIKIDYVPELEKEELKKILQKRFQEKNKTAEEVLFGFLNKKLIPMFLKQSGIKVRMQAEMVKEQQIVQLATKLKELKTTIIDTNGFENAQVTAGGVSTWEVYSDTMESMLVPGLYFTGELLDIDGICGGYNLQWCWSSAYLAAHSICKKITV